MDEERREIEKLKKAVSELFPAEDKAVEMDAKTREYSVTLHGRSFDVERDEFGRIQRLVGPDDTKTLIRDDRGLVTRVDTEEIHEA